MLTTDSQHYLLESQSDNHKVMENVYKDMHATFFVVYYYREGVGVGFYMSVCRTIIISYYNICSSSFSIIYPI